MSSIISRYIVREVVLPFCLALLLFTFLMLLPPIMNQAEELIRIGVDARQVAEMLLLLDAAVARRHDTDGPAGRRPDGTRADCPGDRETVAMQACGLSLFRILTPLLVLATATAAINCYLMLSVVPDANQRFRENFSCGCRRTAPRARCKPRVFYVGDFPDVVLYVQEVSSGRRTGGPMFFSRTSSDRNSRTSTSPGTRRVGVDRERRTGGHRARERRAPSGWIRPSTSATTRCTPSEELRIQLDAESLFPCGTGRIAACAS